MLNGELEAVRLVVVGALGDGGGDPAEGGDVMVMTAVTVVVTPRGG